MTKKRKGDSYMNYYNPSYYMGGYPYGNQYPLPSQQPQPSFQMSQPINTQPAPQPQSLNGKIVDSEDVVRATEVPIGGYGIFPKADLSEIYIKSWNNNGTTSVITFRPIIPEPSAVHDNGELTNLLLQKIEVLENKLDMFISQPIEHQQPQQVIKKAEVSTKNGF